jgi:hypothetical protein
VSIDNLSEFLSEFENVEIDESVDLVKYIYFWWPALTGDTESEQITPIPNPVDRLKLN